MKYFHRIASACLVGTASLYFCHTHFAPTPANIYVWGSGRNGELGIGSESNLYTPTLLHSEHKFVDVSAKRSSSAGISSQGKLYLWGKMKNASNNILIPRPLYLPQKVKFVSCGYNNICAVTESGEVYMCEVMHSPNAFRSIGTKEVERNSKKEDYKTTKIEGLSDIVQVSCSNEHTVALDRTGKVYTWGAKNRLGRDGDQKLPIQVPGLENIVKIDSGLNYSMALDKDGKLHVWGGNEFGQLGIPSVRGKAPTPVVLPVSESFVDVGCGDNYAGAITKQGKVYTWGFGNEGQLGHGDKVDQPSPRALSIEDQTTGAVQISCGGGHTAVLTNQNKLLVFGRGREGQIGRENKDEGSSAYKLRPKVVESLLGKTILKIVCGGNHTMALIKE